MPKKRCGIWRRPNPTLGDRRARFGAGGEVRRGQAPPGPAISASIQLFSLKRPAPGGVRRILFDEKWSLERPRFDLFSHFGSFLRFLKIVDFLMSRWGVEKSVNIVPATSLERPGVSECCAGRSFSARRPTRRPQLSKNRINRLLWILTRPGADGPANFCMRTMFFP